MTQARFNKTKIHSIAHDEVDIYCSCILIFREEKKHPDFIELRGYNASHTFKASRENINLQLGDFFQKRQSEENCNSDLKFKYLESLTVIMMHVCAHKFARCSLMKRYNSRTCTELFLYENTTHSILILIFCLFDFQSMPFDAGDALLTHQHQPSAMIHSTQVS